MFVEMTLPMFMTGGRQLSFLVSRIYRIPAFIAGTSSGTSPRNRLILMDVGHGYLKIYQPLSTLSGGEPQRLKIASELHKEGNIYVMDEPTTELLMSDMHRLYGIIDMGPEGSDPGGEVLFQGRPQDLIDEPRSYTWKYLKEYLP